jgi:starch phosphorylase
MKKSYLMMHNLQDLPAELIPLVEAIADLATDLRWTWSHAGDAIWKAMDPQLWEQSENPFAVMQNLTRKRLEELDRSAEFKQHLERLTSARTRYNDRRGWFSDVHPDTALKGIAYFSMEFGLGQALPLYAGGLGVLAGDYLKAASDLVVPVTAIGLLYQEGYFRQVLDATGWQQEIYPYNDSTTLPLRPVTSSNGAWLHVPIQLPGRTVRLRAWEAQVGQVSLYLLDSNDPLNSAVDRGITSKLYSGGEEMRFVQEIALGIAGWRLIEALNLEIDVCHLNEGHAAFVTLERARSFMQRQQVDFWEALWATRAGNVFTTHTPVAAGFDTFHRDLLEKYGLVYAHSLGVDAEELIALGRCNAHDDDELFSMAYLAARTCGRMNGVSRLHGKVSRKIFQDLYPRWPQQEVPVTHITNGVHVPSWDSPWADELWTRSCGKDRWLGTEAELISMIETLDDETLWTFRGQERADLIHHARQRLRLQLGQRGIGPEGMDQVDQVLDPNVLTLGFARRFTAYKRPNLLLCDPQRLHKLLTNPERPVQIIVAGKAHPADAEGKRLIQEWVRFAAQQDVREHVVFLEDYDIALAQEMVQGIDVWINTPRRSWEASGTSGMKVLVNGGLNLSELDGWWAEAYTPEVGWALGDDAEHDEAGWDMVEAAQLYRLLEDEIVPLFYDRDGMGIPREWVERIRASMATLAPYFSTNRMVREYVEQFYLPAAAAFNKRKAQRGQLARELRQWEVTQKHVWHETHLGQLVVRKQPGGWVFEVQVYLGAVSPEAVQVQVYADANSTAAPACLAIYINVRQTHHVPTVILHRAWFHIIQRQIYPLKIH